MSLVFVGGIFVQLNIFKGFDDKLSAFVGTAATGGGIMPPGGGGGIPPGGATYYVRNN